jgi:hypothetical protein
MKTYRIFGIAICTGSKAELEGVDKLAAGTHFLTAYGNKRGGKRKATPQDEAQAIREGLEAVGRIERGESTVEQETSHVSD